MWECQRPPKRHSIGSSDSACCLRRRLCCLPPAGPCCSLAMCVADRCYGRVLQQLFQAAAKAVPGYSCPCNCCPGPQTHIRAPCNGSQLQGGRPSFVCAAAQMQVSTSRHTVLCLCLLPSGAVHRNLCAGPQSCLGRQCVHQVSGDVTQCHFDVYIWRKMPFFSECGSCHRIVLGRMHDTSRNGKYC
jgi:hypothetical protein